MKTTSRLLLISVLFAVLTIQSLTAFTQPHELQREMRHLRNAGEREWSEFPGQADHSLRLNFSTEAGASDQTLEITQYDVKLLWNVSLNGTVIGRLIQDEKRTTAYFSIPAAVLKADGNVLIIQSEEKIADDIMVGAIRIHRGSVENLMTAALDLSVVGEDSLTIPARITLINDKRSLQTMLASPDNDMAIRPGCIYLDSEVTIRIPAGTYVAYATRGFEYGVDSTIVTVQPGDHLRHRFMVRREVNTKGWIATDTHVHTFTYSRHGDAAIRERVLTLAGEGIEMPVMTDHNTYVDLKPVLDSVRIDHPNLQMTPVVGDEVTTMVGHFNVLDIDATKKVIDHRGASWRDVGKAMSAVAPGKVIILNHARDVHNSFRPFDPARHLSTTGLDRDGWTLPANAMEVINSGSQQTDFMLLFQDWFGMLNGGAKLTPIGSSDSHDVNRFIVGQGRTYVKANDDDAGNINTAEAMRAMLRGQVMVSCGLLAAITVNNTYGPGELAKGKDRVNVRVELQGPAWSGAETVALYMNGVKIKEERVVMKQGSPVQQAFSWDIDIPPHDVFFTAIAQGKASDLPFWPIAKPYQPSRPDWKPVFFAGTGAVWVDGNENNRQESAFVYATKLLSQHKGDLKALFEKLESYDESIASQAAVLLWRKGESLKSEKVRTLVDKSGEHIRRGFDQTTKEIEKLRK